MLDVATLTWCLRLLWPASTLTPSSQSIFMFVYFLALSMSNSTQGLSVGYVCQMLSPDIVNDKIFFCPVSPPSPVTLL